MDCRTFHRNLEDYLQDGLDFSDCFAMERHAQQCIGCGKEMADAQRLHQMALDLKQVKAPSGFESSVIREIGMRKARGRFSSVRSLWIYGFEWPSWRNLILASSGLAVLGFGVFYATHRAALHPAPPPPLAASAPARETVKPVKGFDAKDEPDTNIGRSYSRRPTAAEAPEVAEAAQPSDTAEQEYLTDREVIDTEYVEYQVIGPDNRPLTIRLPRYHQNSEEYFIRNVSH